MIIEYKEKWKEFTISSFQMSDIRNIISIFEKNFKKPMGKTESYNHFVWEYLNNPAEIVTILLARSSSGEIAAQYALLPKQMLVNGEQHICTLSQDTVTDEKYRGKGLFTLLANRLYNLIKEKGVLFTYGFPNKNSSHGFFKKLDWIQIKDIPILFKPIYSKNIDYSVIPLLGKNIFSRNLFKSSVFIHNILFANKADNKTIIRKVNQYETLPNDLWHKSVKSKCCVIRDNKYIKWRFFDKPENDYHFYTILHNGEIKGYFVLLILEKFNMRMLFIIDFLFVEEKFVKEMLSFADRIAIENTCHMISSLTPYIYKKLFISSGYFPLHEKLFPQDLYFGFLPHNINSQTLIEDLGSIKSWYLTWSDIDVV